MKTISVIGAGTMGRGIAHATALAGYDVTLYDVADRVLQDAFKSIGGTMQKAVEKGKLTAEKANSAIVRITTTTHFDHLSSSDLVIEAAVERLEVKQKLFADLEILCSSETILASNTSSLSITSIASACRKPERVLGLHFFNPAHIMKLVEVVRAHRTAEVPLDRAIKFIEEIGKTPVITKDTPGFIVNRVARPFYGEAIRLVGDQGASVETVDAALRGAGFVMGPFELMDLIGIDINFAVTESIHNQFFGEARFRPHPLQQRMVEAGLLGRKTGEGFYRYEDS